MKNTSLSLADIGRTQHVKRWHIVDMLKDQSVAEHSFMVAMICMEIMDVARFHDPGLRAATMAYALIHDATEGITGDVPSPVKGKVQGYSELEAKLDPAGSRFKVRYSGLVSRMVKMADLIEAIHHLEKYGMRGPARDCTLRTLTGKLSDLQSLMDEKHPLKHAWWAGVVDKVRLSMHCSNLTIVEEACRV